MVMITLLKTTIAGLGNGETPIFPVQVLKLKDGVDLKKGDPNYDIFQLACEASAKRLYPNFVNLDAPYNKELYIEGRPETEMATMGCVDFDEVIRYRLNGKENIDKIGKAFNVIYMQFGDKKHLKQINNKSVYIDTSEENVEVYDSKASDFVQVKGFIMNKGLTKEDWVELKFNNNLSLYATKDHPLPIENKGRTRADEVQVGDRVKTSDLYKQALKEQDKDIEENVEVVSVNTKLTDTDVMNVKINCSYDLETVSDRLDISFLQSHNCRTRVGKNVYDPDKSVIPGRGNLSFTSINLPRLGIKSNGNIETFYKLLDEKMELVHKELLERFEIQCKKHPLNYPFLMGQGCWIESEKLGPNDDIRSILKHGSLTVGFIGLAETLVALIGEHHGESEEAQKLGLEIVQHMRDYTDAWSKDEHMNYTLLGTPAEGLSGRFVRMDKQVYGEIKGVTDKEYYTNSSHVPVSYPISAYKKIQIEAPYHAIENGGHILYVELEGDPSKNLTAFEKLVVYMHDCNAGYFALNHQLDSDPVCGYVGVIGETCPRCGRKEGEPMTMEMWYKIKGYANAGNWMTIGYHGDINEENDRIPNTTDTTEVANNKGTKTRKNTRKKKKNVE